LTEDRAPHVKRERIAWVFAPLMILHLVLLSLQIEDSSGTILLKTWALRIQTPVFAASDAVFGGIRQFWHDYIWLIDAREESRQLKEKVSRLSILNKSYEEARLENRRLRRLVSMIESISGDAEFSIVGARVSARTPEFLANILYVDRGSKHGVRINAPVISGDGIVGRVVLVTELYSQVQLITNPDASIGAMLSESRTPGILTGTGDELLTMNYISNILPVKTGEVVVSSGLDDIFPKGIVIGEVVVSERGKDIFREIKVKPAIDLIRLEEVAILLD
jgi:rod shape-determining protein MreC